ncbi:MULTISPECIES: NUDIX hydrolase N-terminal domain-containing protein [Staphylococcus]|uniref:NUDIX hydrolase N-terminal domain-containing protein n=1 Tax=Staphylococcus TaxID=1279 RepID=UPI000BDE7D57|nr:MULTISPECIES: NUDIX hydrolase N-terminal domain-containing protein [Staphylococcus]NWN84341.1 NUDIX hydrolase N-terminal domain-containing protein [Staphylococcus sp.]
MGEKEFFQRLLAISNEGLNYSKDPYDIERYNNLFDITQKFINTHLTQKPINFHKEQGYPTPKIDVRALILDHNDHILLVEDSKTKLWALPGGFAEIGISPVENITKEVKEETGLNTTVKNLIAVYDTNKSNPENALAQYYKLIYYCKKLSGNLTTSIETSSVAFFDLKKLPVLSTKRNTEQQIIDCFNNKNGKTIIE